MTTPDKSAPCPLDHVNRQFQASRPNELWVSDFTYVSTWQGWLYVAFVIDVYARRIVAWRVSRSMQTDFVQDALEQALYDRQPAAHALRIIATGAVNTSAFATPNAWTRRAYSPRFDSPPGTLEDQGIRGAGHPAMGALVQPRPTAHANWGHPSGRS